VATISRLIKITGLFCKRALQKRLYSAKETYNFQEPTNRSHPIQVLLQLLTHQLFIYIYLNTYIHKYISIYMYTYVYTILHMLICMLLQLQVTRINYQKSKWFLENKHSGDLCIVLAL